MLDDDPDQTSLLSYHFAIGLAVQPQDAEIAPVPQITKDGIWALHHTAHKMALDGEILLEDYSNQQIAAALAACETGIRLLAGGVRGEAMSIN
jgi:hypothetical protein